MGESAEVNLITEGGSKGEDEDGEEDEFREEDEGWWVGTVSLMESPEWTGGASCITPGLGPAQSEDQGEGEGDDQIECGHESQVIECSEGEMAGDE
jgi:hypothetical protein